MRAAAAEGAHGSAQALSCYYALHCNQGASSEYDPEVPGRTACFVLALVLGDIVFCCSGPWVGLALQQRLQSCVQLQGLLPTHAVLLLQAAAVLPVSDLHQ